MRDSVSKNKVERNIERHLKLTSRIQCTHKYVSLVLSADLFTPSHTQSEEGEEKKRRKEEVLLKIKINQNFQVMVTWSNIIYFIFTLYV